MDKCLPFGSSISCVHFQAFSNAVAHIVEYFIKKKVVNYLDDYLFAALFRALYNAQVQCFLDVCAEINFPVSLEKTFWGTASLVFLGLLIDTVKQLVCVLIRARDLITNILEKRKITLDTLQKLCGFLNFLCRAFTRCLYAKTTGVLKLHHHLTVTSEMKADWNEFLAHPSVFCRPFIDFTGTNTQDIDFFSDASRIFNLGMGAISDSSWMFMKWQEEVATLKPSIEYLELYALTGAVLAWGFKLASRRGQVGSASDCRAGERRFKSRHPTSAETCMWGRRLAAMLALYTGKGVSPEMNLRECISCMPPHSSNKPEPTLALKPRGDVTRSPKQGYQWPHKRTCLQQKFKKKKVSEQNCLYLL